MVRYLISASECFRPRTVDMSVVHVIIANVRFCGDYYSGSRLTSTNNTMTLVFESWDNYNHWTGFSASYLVTGSGKYNSTLFLLVISTGNTPILLLLIVSTGIPPALFLLAVSTCLPPTLFLAMVSTSLPPTLFLAVVSTGASPTLFLLVVCTCLPATMFLLLVSTGLPPALFLPVVSTDRRWLLATL